MISRMAFCSDQARTIASARFGPIPSTSCRRSGACSMTSNTLSPKAPNELLAIDGPDPPDHARAEVAPDPLDAGRRRDLEEARLQLRPVAAVVDPGPARLEPFAGCDGGGVANHRDQVTLPAHLDPEDAEAVLGVVERHPLNEAGQDLLLRRWKLSRARLAHGACL